MGEKTPRKAAGRGCGFTTPVIPEPDISYTNPVMANETAPEHTLLERCAPRGKTHHSSAMSHGSSSQAENTAADANMGVTPAIPTLPKTSEDGIALVTNMMPAFEDDIYYLPGCARSD